jgi:hypothetical protein
VLGAQFQVCLQQASLQFTAGILHHPLQCRVVEIPRLDALEPGDLPFQALAR